MMGKATLRLPDQTSGFHPISLHYRRLRMEIEESIEIALFPRQLPAPGID